MNDVKILQSVFQTLSDYNRLAILKSICDKECAVGEVVKLTGLSQPLVSHHLKVLRANQFLNTKRDGPFIYYFLKDEKIVHAINMFLEIFKDSDIHINSDKSFCHYWSYSKFNHKL
jgi:DNA-binding transcriptional ArsR family regulator